MYLGEFAVVVNFKEKIDTDLEVLNDLFAEQAGSDIVAKKMGENAGFVCAGNIQHFASDDKHLTGYFHLTDMGKVADFTSQVLNNAGDTASNKDLFENSDGKFGFTLWDKGSQTLSIVTDPMRFCSLYLYKTDAMAVVSTDLRYIKALIKTLEVSTSAIYHYLNFSYVPSSSSIYTDVEKIPPGTAVTISAKGVEQNRYWKAIYPEDLKLSEEEARERLRDEVIKSVLHTRPTTDDWGVFLSGGTDSSSIAGILAKNSPSNSVHSFSIGFSEEGYDELGFAEIAAKSFGLDAHYGRVSADDALNAIDKLVDAYDEPFGNSSAIPTFYCAKMARELGIHTMLGGDGGDEIFGGNERYAKDKIFSQYYNSPAVVKMLGSFGASLLKPFDFRLANRVKNFIKRASLPNPDRFYLDDSFASEFYGEMLSDGFRQSVQQDESLEVIKEIYQGSEGASELHRLMYIDLQMAIADNDLTKVNKTAKAAGVSVLYPYLNTNLIKFTGRLPDRFKVSGVQKRYLFKKSMSDILPHEIITKKKQGFGLPVSVWLKENKKFIELINDTLLSQKSVERGYFSTDFITKLVSRHQKGTWDYSQEIWMLLMLELWHRKYVDEK